MSNCHCKWYRIASVSLALCQNGLKSSREEYGLLCCCCCFLMKIRYFTSSRISTLPEISHRDKREDWVRQKPFGELLFSLFQKLLFRYHFWMQYLPIYKYPVMHPVKMFWRNEELLQLQICILVKSHQESLSSSRAI